MPMRPLAMPIRPLVMPMHPLVIPIRPLVMPMRSLALKTLRFYAMYLVYVPHQLKSAVYATNT